MKRRYVYSMLFAVPGFFISLIISFVVFGSAAGFLWLFVFGDNPWPSSIEKIFPVLFVVVFSLVWFACLIVGFVVGKRFEENPISDKRHILASAGVTILFILVIVLYQVRIGNIGSTSEGERCREFCNQKGYSTTSMPPRDSGERSCSCLDSSGIERIKISLDSIR